ncbi:MAG TPA: hypothetical protein VNU45_03860 [Rummeliibacillus sp.]|nr:hypothetical protein [Rummeliibacillus sp.]
MKVFLKIFIGLFLIFLLTACIGEKYDFTPPTVSLMTTTSLIEQELEEVNIDWHSDKDYTKETKDVLAFAREQEPLYFDSEQQVDLMFDSEDFLVKEISVSVWKNDEQVKLKLDKYRSFYMPNEKGDYLIEVNLLTDSGSAQYVGNVVIQ